VCVCVCVGCAVLCVPAVLSRSDVSVCENRCVAELLGDSWRGTSREREREREIERATISVATTCLSFRSWSH